LTRFRPKDYLTPGSSTETVQVLQRQGSKARILAGGTTFYELAKRGMMPEVDTIVDLAKLNLDYAKMDADSAVIGSMITLTDLLNTGICTSARLHAIEDFLSRFTPIQIRNLATVGGEFCSGIPFLDLPVAALALDARLRVVGPNGSRDVPVESFFLDYFLVDLKKGEYLTEVRIPKAAEGSASAFANYKRTSTDLSLVSVGVGLTLADDGSCKDIKIGLGGMGQIALRAHRVEENLKGTNLQGPSLEKALALVEELSPISSIHASQWYKKEVCRTLIRDAIDQAKLRVSRGLP
jgi:carbon-monoxide dehydrogenase medium subunit